MAGQIMDVDVTASLWTYMEKTWVPRGQETARILYNTTRGWVTHNEVCANSLTRSMMMTFIKRLADKDYPLLWVI